MSIPFSGTFKRSGGVVSAIGKQLKSVNLKPVNKVLVKFDPFAENITPTRDFLYYLTAPKIIKTNPSCGIKTEIICDRSEPIISFDLATGEKIIFKSFNLTTLELLQLYNKHVSVLAPVEAPVAEVQTKSGKKGGGKRR